MTVAVEDVEAINQSTVEEVVVREDVIAFVVVEPLSVTVCRVSDSVIVCILSYRAFLVGTSIEPFHPAQYASSGTLKSPVIVSPLLFTFASRAVCRSVWSERVPVIAHHSAPL